MADYSFTKVSSLSLRRVRDKTTIALVRPDLSVVGKFLVLSIRLDHFQEENLHSFVCCVWCLFFEFSPSLPLVSFPLFPFVPNIILQLPFRSRPDVGNFYDECCLIICRFHFSDSTVSFFLSGNEMCTSFNHRPTIKQFIGRASG